MALTRFNMTCRFFFLLSSLAMSYTLAAADLPAAEKLLQLRRPLVVGHRGFNVLAPENTIPSFEFAKQAGVDMVELDYHHTKDGVPIVIHDGAVDRTTDATNRWPGGKLGVKDRTAAELKTLDAGSWFNPRYAGTRLPLLTEALDCIQQGNITLIERKGGEPATCIQLLRDRHLINQVIVQSFDWEYLREFHRQAPEQILGALGPHGSRAGRKLTDEEKALNSEWIAGARETGARLIVWNKQVSRASIAHAHEQGLKVLVYTINDATVAQELLDLGVDGLITDNAAIIWRAMALRSPRQDTR